MKILKVTFFLFLLGQLANAQDNKELLTKALSQYSTGNSFSSVGNFASISTANQTLKGSVFFLDPNNQLMYNIDFAAGTIEGISTLFNEGKLNTSVSLGGNIRWISNKWIDNIASQSADTIEVFEIDKEIAINEYEKKLFDLIKKVTLDESKLISNNKLVNQKKNIDDLMKKIEQKKYSSSTKTKLSDLLEKELEILSKNLENKVKQEEKLDYFINQANFLNSKKLDKLAEIDKKINALEIAAVKLNYWSFGYSAKRDDFKLFIDSLEIGKQLTSKDYISHEVRFSFNALTNLMSGVKGSILGFGKRKFFSVGAVFNYTSNLSSLDKVEVIDTKIVDSTLGRTKVKKQNAFEGEFTEDISSINLFVDYYTFLSKKESSFAVHLNPELLISDFRKPVTSFQFGFLIPFKDKKDQKTSVNLEFFYKIKDVFNTTESVNSLLNRNQIGIQTTFPFNF
jgi:hypothetical protein